MPHASPPRTHRTAGGGDTVSAGESARPGLVRGLPPPALGPPAGFHPFDLSAFSVKWGSCHFPHWAVVTYPRPTPNQRGHDGW